MSEQSEAPDVDGLVARLKARCTSMAGPLEPERLAFPVQCSLLYEAADALTRTREELEDALEQNEEFDRKLCEAGVKLNTALKELSALRSAQGKGDGA